MYQDTVCYDIEGPGVESETAITPYVTTVTIPIQHNCTFLESDTRFLQSHVLDMANSLNSDPATIDVNVECNENDEGKLAYKVISVAEYANLTDSQINDYWQGLGNESGTDNGFARYTSSLEFEVESSSIVVNTTWVQFFVIFICFVLVMIVGAMVAICKKKQYKLVDGDESDVELESTRLYDIEVVS
jgi:hypothetical protein